MARAASLGIEVLAITDHDTTEGLPAALAEAQRQGITVVPGVEISTISGREEIHLLGYFVDLDNAELQALLARTRAGAPGCEPRQMLARLAKLGTAHRMGSGGRDRRGTAVHRPPARGSDTAGGRPREQLRRGVRPVDWPGPPGLCGALQAVAGRGHPVGATERRAAGSGPSLHLHSQRGVQGRAGPETLAAAAARGRPGGHRGLLSQLSRDAPTATCWLWPSSTVC